MGGLGPAVVDVDDFNGDGILDIAVASHNGLGILVGQGNLAYQNVLQFPVSPFPYSPAFGDFNGDGHIDFAVATNAGIALVFGNGDGTLHSADTYDLGDHVSSVVSGDFNGDMIPDIAVGLSDAPPRILLGKGDGTFTITPDQGMPNNTFMGLTGVGDFNGDHIPDLLSAVGNGFVEFGMGDGTFSALASLPNAGPSLAGAFTADFNNDGIADLAFLRPPNVIFMTAKPDHTYSQSTATLPTSPSFLSGSMAFADLNNAGKLDAVVNNSGGGAVAIFLGNGDGTFVSGPVYTTTSSTTSSFALADLDGDGNIDIVLCSGNSSANPIIQTGFEIQVLYGHGDGTFQNPVAFPTSHSVATIAAGDLNMDGIADLVLSDGNVVTIMNGASNRTFGPPRDYLAGDFPSTPLIIDLNGDGGPDLVFANSETNGVNTATVLLNLGVTRGTLTATPSLAVYGQPVLLSASFVGTVAGSGLPSGPVGFSFNNGVPIPSTLQNGAASITDSQLLAVGTHSIQASWVGDDTFNAHKLSGQIAISKADTSLTLSASPAIAVIGQTAVVTAQAVPQYEGVPTGTVQFQSGSTPVFPVKLDSSAAATLAVDTSTLAVGTYSYTASYPGDANFNPSASAATQLKVADFSIAVSPGAVTVLAGSTATASVNATTSSGFNGSIDLSCTGIPTSAHCSFAPASLSLANAASATSTLTVTTTSAATFPPGRRNGDKPLLPQSLERFAVILAVILLVWRTRGPLSWRPAQVAGLVCLAVTGIFAGCGGGSSGGGGTPQPTSFTAQVLATVHGSSPATSRTATLTVTIQQ
jgi:hypothetical protein